TSFPMVSKPTFVGGLGFGMKWMMGWMNDTLAYFQKDAFYRQYHQNDITFSLAYAFTENFMLPLSHDEVVHGKGPLIGRMPGDEWQRFANLRLLYGWMYTHPGTKLLFMGGEIGQTSEWKHDNSVEWHLLDHPPHQGIKAMVTGINKLYTSEPAMYELGFSSDGFEWIELNDAQNSVLSYMRKGTKEKDTLIIVANFTPVVRENYRVGVSKAGAWKEIFNSDAAEYGGSGLLNKKAIKTAKTPYHGRDNSLQLNVPPLGITVLKKVVASKKK
ncbi:MAG: alpha amylase C-terminal domain-containing protein, partial [Fulvivirga sp.]